MNEEDCPQRSFPSAGEDAGAARKAQQMLEMHSPSYLLAYTDEDFLMRDELRPIRLQLELMKPELLQHDHAIESTIVIFGSTRIPERKAARSKLEDAERQAAINPGDPFLARKVKIARSILEKAHYYEQARELARLITEASQEEGSENTIVVTGGGPGIMEAANRGAHDCGGKSMGFNIVLAKEQLPNPFITPDLCFQFHYFAIRKMHFLMRAKVLIAFPGGFGTLDELFETLTLMQTRKVRQLPVILFGRHYWERIVNFEALVEEGTIDPEDLDLFRFVETVEEAWEIIRSFPPRPSP